MSTFTISTRAHQVEACPSCGGWLVLHQPAPSDPDRLLGICDACRGWYVIHTLVGTMTSVPG